MGDKGASSSATAQAEQPKPQSIAHYINKIKQGDNATWEKDELLNVIYWFHQVSGVLLGIVFALGDITGFMGVMLFWLTSVAITMGGLKSVLGIDEEQYGSLFELLFEGMMGSFASFLVAWILTFSALQ